MVNQGVEIERTISVEGNDTSKATAIVTTTTKNNDGDVEVIEKTFEGTLDEVTEKASAYSKKEKRNN